MQASLNSSPRKININFFPEEMGAGDVKIKEADTNRFTIN